MQQLALLNIPKATLPKKPVSQIGAFSHDGVCDEEERQALEEKFAAIICETERFSRKTVSFQANKVEALHNWVHYREGFSAELVERLLDELCVQENQTVLDPFAGSCTTLLAAMQRNAKSIGIELLPHCHLAWVAKSHVYDYDLDELCLMKERLMTENPPLVAGTFPHITITASAFSAEIEQDILNYTAWVDSQTVSDASRTLLCALIMSILEDVSYTRKDGQYLRWDGRAEKIIARNQKRILQGKKAFRGIDKGTLPTVKDALVGKLGSVIRDIEQLQREDMPTQRDQTLIRGNTLFVLPALEANSVDAVITSPPYANRYDYTRTYALELAYLQINDEIFGLRQGLLSCTVENKSKRDQLAKHYDKLGASERYRNVIQLVEDCAVLNEVNQALRVRLERGEINNKGVLRMVKQYFVELTFVFAELFRVCVAGGQIVFVNDNVRYAGEVIPVDTISTHLAQAIGFEPKVIYVIPQRKGNSSQQMKRFGRRELRKSITVWQKPTD